MALRQALALLADFTQQRPGGEATATALSALLQRTAQHVEVVDDVSQPIAGHEKVRDRLEAVLIDTGSRLQEARVALER